MPSDSFVTTFDWNSLGEEQEKRSECTFWTGRNGQMCVQYFRPAADVHYQPHTHSEYTFVVCVAGAVTVKQLGQEQTIGPGEAVAGNHGVEHSSAYRARHGRACEAVSVALDRRLLADLTGDFGLPPVEGVKGPIFQGKAQGSVLKDCAEVISNELRRKNAGHKLVIETQAVRLLIEIIRAWPRSGISEMEADSSNRLPHREFVRAYEYMRWCRKESFRLQHLCRFLGSSEERFTRLFLASTQMTPASFYNRLLLDQACGLLRNEKLSIKEIGFELGFKTSSHFIATFRREYGMSPQEYRLQTRGCDEPMAVVVPELTPPIPSRSAETTLAAC